MSLLRFAVSGGATPEIADWDIVINKLRDHAILPLLLPLKKQLKIPVEIGEQLKTEQYHISMYRIISLLCMHNRN